MRRTKATLIYRRTKNLRAVQLLLGHSKLESTVRCLSIGLKKNTAQSHTLFALSSMWMLRRQLLGAKA